MDDFGNIIYILAAIGWFFWNAYKKTQQGKEKKGAQPERSRPEPETVETESDDPFKSFEEIILEQLEGKKQEPEPVPIEVAPKPPVQERNHDKFLNMDLDNSGDYQMSVSEGQNHRQRRASGKRSVPEENEGTGLMDELFPEEGFDLRKAVVLNAILERPYK